jgi:hypothetical protein
LICQRIEPSGFTAANCPLLNWTKMPCPSVTGEGLLPEPLRCRPGLSPANVVCQSFLPSRSNAIKASFPSTGAVT